MEIFYRKKCITGEGKKREYKKNKDIRSHEVFMLMPLCKPTKNISQGFLSFFISCFNTKP